MSGRELFEAIGEIDGDLVARCENEAVSAPKRTRVKWLPAAACLCLAAVLCVFAISRQTSNISAPLASGNGGGQTTASEETSLSVNQLDEEPSFQSATISLNMSDFVSMTDDEFLKYYGVSFRVSEAVPALALQPQDVSDCNGIFENSSRGTYYDTHTFVFADDSGSERFEITLSKTAYYPGMIAGQEDSGAQLEQSEINGYAVTIFRYTGEDGSACCYTEFLNGGIAYCVTSYNLSQEDFTAALTSVIADNVDTETSPSGADQTHTVTGTVDAVDENAGLISVSSGDGAFSALEVYLPAGGAKAYSVGDEVEVSYTGNPITIRTIWAQQLNGVDILS